MKSNKPKVNIKLKDPIELSLTNTLEEKLEKEDTNSNSESLYNSNYDHELQKELQTQAHPVEFKKSDRVITFDYYDHKSKKKLTKVLTYEIELELIKTCKDLNIPLDERKEAMRRLLQAYDTYIISLLRKSYKYSGVSEEDLKQHAIIGFMEAVQNFNIEKSNGARIMTYAFNHIKKNVTKVIKQLAYATKSVTTKDANLAKTLIQRIKAERELTNQDYEDIAKSLNNKTAAYVRGIEGALTPVRSLNDEDENGNSIISNIEDDNSDFYEDVVEDDNANIIRNAFFEAFSNVLNEREQYIVKHRIAVDFFDEVKEKATLSSLADYLNVSTERVRQIENKAKEKLQEAMSKFQDVEEY